MQAILKQIKDSEQVLELFSKNDSYGRIPVHYAAEYGNSDVIKSMLAKIEDVKQIKKLFSKKDFYSYTPMHYVARYENSAVMEAILEKIKGSQQVLELLTKTNKLGRTPLHYAAKNKNQSVMEAILKNVSEAQRKSLLSLVNKNNETPYYLLDENGYNIKRVNRIIRLRTGSYSSGYSVSIPDYSSAFDFASSLF